MGKRKLNPRVFVDGVQVGSLVPPRDGVTAFWWFRWTPPSGHVQRMSTGALTEPNAKKVAEDYHRAHAEELIATVPGAGAAVAPGGRASTLGEFAELFIKAKVKEDGTGDWGDKTQRKHCDITRKFASYTGKDRPLAIFNRKAVEKWVEYDRTRPKENGDGIEKQSGYSVNSNLDIVKSFGNWLWDKEYIPAQINFRHLRIKKAALRNKRQIRNHAPAEIAQIARHLKTAGNDYLKRGDAEYWFDMFRIGVGIGTRPAELVWMRVCDFNADAGMVKIQEFDEHNVKTEGSIRDIPLAKLAPEVLEALKRRAKDASKLGHTLLFGKNGRGCSRKRLDVAWPLGSLLHAFQNAIEDCGVHSFPEAWRHCFVRRAYAAEWSDQKIALYTGHVEYSTTRDYGRGVTAMEMVKRDILPGVFEGVLELVPATVQVAKEA